MAFDAVDISIGKQLKEQRIKKHYSMQYLADRIGIQKSTYFYCENGRTGLSVGNLVKACEVLGLDYVQVIEKAKRYIQ